MRKVWQAWYERALIGALLASCLILALLQYRWTAELSEVETSRMVAGMRPRLHQLAMAFDQELRLAVQGLTPSSEAVGRRGAAAANQDRLEAASPDIERPMFRRISAAVRHGDEPLQYFEVEPSSNRFEPKVWPADPTWQALRQRLQDIAGGASPRGQVADPATALIEVPVFVDGSEREWMLFELNLEYVTATWLPEMIRSYLNLDGDDAFRVAVFWRANRGQAVFVDPPGPPPGVPDAEETLFPLRYRSRGGGRPEPGRWIINVSRRQGSTPAAVQSAYRSNLMVGLMLLALILAAAAVLVHNTREARRLAAAQYQFLAGISHELRTPLTVIQGAGHNLLSGVVTDAAQRESYLRAIVTQSGQLTEMVEQLLGYGAVRKAEAAGAGSAMLDVVISETIDTAAPELEQAGRSVDVDMPPDLPPVKGSAMALRRIFGNLILNAIRHGGGEVTVVAQRSGDMVEVRVADTGPGIADQELKHVFEPFFRGERARTGRTRGTGLGLSLVKESVEKLGGTVTVESKPGKGTAFTVRLPVAS